MTPDQEDLIRKAHQALRAAKLLAAEGLIDHAVSRAYYAMFHVAQALLLEKGLTFSKHGSLLAAFGQHFTKTGLIPSILSKIRGSRKMPGRKIALNLRGLIFLPHIFLLKPGPVRDTPPRIFETIRFLPIFIAT